MIFVTSDIAIGSKAFMLELADAIRPTLSSNWDAEELDDFDLSLMQDMVHFGDLSIDDFNVAFEAVINADVDEAWKADLLNAMQSDPRYKAASSA